MYLSEKYSLKYLWIFEMVLELISVLSCFVLIIIQIPSNPSVDYSPEKEYKEYDYQQNYLNSLLSRPKTLHPNQPNLSVIGRRQLQAVIVGAFFQKT